MKKIKKRITCAVVLLLGVVALSVIRGTHGDAACSHPKTTNSTVVSPTCTAKGYTKVVCVTCGAQVGKTNWTDALGHSYKAATCASPQKCTRCGHTTGQPSKTHSSIVAATCTSPKKCTTCGATFGGVADHSYKAATCASPQKCKNCGHTTGQPSKTHTSIVAATCTSPKKCTTCGATFGKAKGHSGVDGASCVNKLKCTTCKKTIGDHSWNAATCTTPKTCAICNKTSGKKLGHSWAKATCYAPKTCKRTGCNATSGDPLEHKFSKATCKKLATCSRCKITTGDYAHVAKTAATCTTQAVCKKCKKSYGDLAEHNYTIPGTVPPSYGNSGYHYMACSVCGAKKITEEIPAVSCYTVTFQHDGKITTTNVSIGGTFTIPADIDAYEKDRNRLYWVDELSSDGAQYIVGQAIDVEKNMSLVPVYEEIYRQIGTVKNPANGIPYNVWLIDEMSLGNSEAYYTEFLKKHPESNNLAILLVNGKTCYRIKDSWRFIYYEFRYDVCSLIINYNNQINNTGLWNRGLASSMDEWGQHNIFYMCSFDESYLDSVETTAKIMGYHDTFVEQFRKWMLDKSVDVDIDANAKNYISPEFIVRASVIAIENYLSTDQPE